MSQDAMDKEIDLAREINGELSEENSGGERIKHPPMPVSMPTREVTLPDGKGLSLEEVQALLAKYNSTIVDKDDPVLLMVTILNAFLAEQDKQSQKHTAALEKLLGERTDAYVNAVQASVDGLSAAISGATGEKIEKLTSTHEAEIRRHKTLLLLSTCVNGATVVCLVCGLVLMRFI